MTLENLVWGYTDYKFLNSYIWASLSQNIQCGMLASLCIWSLTESELKDGWEVAGEGKVSEISNS